MVKITINDHVFEAEEKVTVLQVVKANGIKIPTLCHHPALRPIGACKLCAIEVLSKTGEPVTRLSCVLRVRDGLEIKTESDLVSRARVRAFRNLLSMAPQSEFILNLAKEYGVDVGPPPDGCIRCRLCIRVCKEVIGPAALRMEKRDGKDYVVPNEGLCIGCGTCANICKTGAIKMVDQGNVRTISIRDEIVGIHTMERCQACGILFATEKYLKHLQERTSKHVGTKDEHVYCPTCHKLLSDRIKSSEKIKRI
ncbi:2Fe-2S iron-sulfur cluster-binding protein [Thermodesulfobacteriota bacterium]